MSRKYRKEDSISFETRFLIFLGMILLLLYIIAVLMHLYPNWSAIGTALLISLASLLFGSLVGFVFGLPRVISNSSSYNNIYGDNSNLDQISDWLLKILVGVGLTQLLILPTALTNYAEFVKPSLGNSASSGIVGISLLVVFSVGGFLIGYLCTRCHAAPMFMKVLQEQNEIKKTTDNSKKEIIDNTTSIANRNKKIIEGIQENQLKFVNWMREITDQINIFEEDQKEFHIVMRENSPLNKELDYIFCIDGKKCLEKVQNIKEQIEKSVNIKENGENEDSGDAGQQSHNLPNDPIIIQRMNENKEKIKKQTNEVGDKNKEIMIKIRNNQNEFAEWMHITKARLEAITNNQKKCNNYIKERARPKTRNLLLRPFISIINQVHDHENNSENSQRLRIK